MNRKSWLATLLIVSTTATSLAVDFGGVRGTQWISYAQWTIANARADQDTVFRDAKTIFQTNTSYDPRLSIAADGVIVHRHAAEFQTALQAWADNGFFIGRMFFADSDAGNIYWTGKWDGNKYPGDVERDRDGEIVKCANVRPYMLPTDTWIRYLEEMTDKSLSAGAGAILPEEPLAHVFTGYEDGFKQLWEKRYNEPWQAQHESAEALWMTAQLKNELYIELERRLLNRTKRPPHADAGFILPIHSIYSNIAARLVAPLGTSVEFDGIDGYIGQIWTGPVNWALGNYDSPDKSFFASAYILYDYFNQLTTRSDKKLWLLIDPVEDNPDHTWSEFAEWYKHCAAAMLLITDVDAYEIMPWPDRIFLPGYQTGGHTPAPEDYRTTILAVTQVLQEVSPGGTRFFGRNPNDPYPNPGLTKNPRIGIAMADTLMWQEQKNPKLQNVYSLFMPLIRRGVEVSSFCLERSADRNYTRNFDVIILCYENFKPTSRAMNQALAKWVEAGGRLMILGHDGDELDACKRFWWQEGGFDSPLAHLLKCLQAPDTVHAQWAYGQGKVLYDPISPRQFAEPAIAESSYLTRLKQLIQPATLNMPGSFRLKRGPFIIASAETEPITLEGRLIDIFDPNLALRRTVTLTPGHSGLYRDVSQQLKNNHPTILHATHRLITQSCKDGILTFTIKGPAQSPATARIHTPYPGNLRITATSPDDIPVAVEIQTTQNTARIKFPNHPKGITVTVQ